MYNTEHYRDPTAGLALRNISYQEQRENRRYHLAYTAPGYVVMVPVRKGKAIFMVRRQRPCHARGVKEDALRHRSQRPEPC